MAAAVAALLLLATAAPSPGFSAFEQLCIATDTDAAKVQAAATAAGYAADPGHADTYQGPLGKLTVFKTSQKAVKDLGDVALVICQATLPVYAQADVDAYWHWMGHTGSAPDGPVGAFEIVEAGQRPHEMAFNRPDKAQTALRTGRLRLVSAQKVGDGLRLMYGVAAPDPKGSK